MVKKRKPSAVAGPSQPKVMKMCNVPLTVDNGINDLLTKLNGDDFDKYMLNKGPRVWKDTLKEVSLDEGKRLLLMVICRPNLLQALSVFCTLWEDETEPALHLYELQLGNAVTQLKVPNSPKLEYLRLAGKVAHPGRIHPLLPTLNHNRHYFCLNKNFIKYMTSFDLLPLRLDLEKHTREELYYKKLSNAMMCAKLHRWPECFAYGLSALDAHEENYSYLHDVLCFIALAGGKMSVPLEWCCAVLEEARRVSTSFEQTWRRLTTFQSLLVDRGLFDLENDLFNKSLGLFVQTSNFGQTLIEQHIQSLLAQVENNLAYQYIRQTFHDDCETFCTKEPHHKQSFEACAKFLKSVDVFTSRLFSKGLKEYYRGFCYLYQTMTKVHRPTGDVRSALHFNVAVDYFGLARLNMIEYEPLKAELTKITDFLKKNEMSFGSISDTFSSILMTRYTHEASQMFFRMMLITMFWENNFQPFPLAQLAQQAKDAYAKITNGTGYRTGLLQACVDIQDISFCHIKDKDPQDYPPVYEENKVVEASALRYWEKEKTDEGFKAFARPKKSTCKVASRAQNLLQNNILAEQVYAFGYQIAEALSIQL